MSAQFQSRLDGAVPLGKRIRAHLAIARFDHVTKNVFILPGIAIPLSVQPELWTSGTALRVLYGLIAASLIACSNYVINEVLDAPYDRFHPSKRTRPVAAGLVHIPLAYVQWLLMMAAGLAIGLLVSKPFVIVLI
ncbi:MAG: UbiA family prenyltransferase, partial [Candidatus Binataceae bacterium]